MPISILTNSQNPKIERYILEYGNVLYIAFVEMSVTYKFNQNMLLVR